MSAQASLRLVLLLGRRDRPTDGVADYCRYLAQALEQRGHRVVAIRVGWAEGGWVSALRRLWRSGRRWRGRWVLPQYTALAWSRRGFPIRFLAVLGVLKVHRCRIAIVFHDPIGYPGERVLDRARRALQHRVMRLAYRLAERVVLNVPVESVPWLPRPGLKATHIPVGANVPIPSPEELPERADDSLRTVAVFGVTGGPSQRREVADIARAACDVARTLGRIRLLLMGRGSTEAEAPLRKALNGTDAVELRVLGLLPSEALSRSLAAADVSLFVRGPVSSQRGSAVAALALGLPIVGYRGPQTGFPLTDAGLRLVPYRDVEGLGRALAEVLSPSTGLLETLRHRSLAAYRAHFSWDAIAAGFEDVLVGPRTGLSRAPEFPQWR